MSIVDPPDSPVSTNGRSCEIPLSPEQRLIWIGQRMHPDIPLYEMPHVFHIHGRIDSDRFLAAFNNFVTDTDVLRCVFSTEDPSKQQLVCMSEPPAECRYIDLSREPHPDLVAGSLQKQLVAQSLNLQHSLYEAALLRISDCHSVWFMKLHHLLTDASNSRALLYNLSEHYRALEESFDPPTATQYTDRPGVANSTAAAGDSVETCDWWHNRCGKSEGTRFFHSRPVIGSVRHQRVIVPLDRDVMECVNAAAAEKPFRQFSSGLSRFNVFATALACWLHRLEGNSEFNIGTTVHCRSTLRQRQTVGLFMQQLPLRISITNGLTAASLASALADETAGMLRNMHAAPHNADAVRSFDVVLNLPDLSTGDFSGMPTTLDWLHNGFGDTERRLTLSVRDSQAGDGIELLFDFNEAVFDPEDQQRAITQYCSTLREVIRTPEKQISDISFVDSSDADVIHQRLTGIPVDLSDDDCNVWHRFVSAVDLNSRAVAVCDDHQSLTYSELQRLAEDLAEKLAEVCEGDVVPVLCRRDANAIVGIMGVLSAGRCFMPVDLDLPPVRISQLLEDCCADWVVNATAAPVVEPVSDWLRNADSENTAGHSTLDTRLPSVRSESSDACYLLYTSGSTGRPNGVLVGHRSLINLLAEFERLAPLECSNCSWWTNVGFDVSMYEIFSSLLFGRTLCIPNDSVRGDESRLFSWMDKHQIESAYLPPFCLRALDSYLADRILPLKRLLVGVEPISWMLLNSIANHLPELRLINGYGPTEATVCATLMPITAGNQRISGPAPIGRPVSGISLRIVDQYNHDAVPGVVGELWIGGRGLAIGYLNRPSLNASRFVRCESSNIRWYRSGDLVRLRRDGCLEFVGRTDDQVKINGYRIEPNEITRWLREYPTVDDCVVAADKLSNSIRLFAFCTASSGLDEADVRSFLAERLPVAVVPSRIIKVDSLPRSMNGKVDIGKLLATAVIPTAETRTAPRNAVEYLLHSIWKQILNLSDFGVEQSFFELGGDSLDAVKIVAQAASFDLSLQPSDVFAHPTIAALASALDSKHLSRPALPEPVSAQRLTLWQRQFWNLSRLHPDTPAYHLPIQVDVSGHVSGLRVTECFQQLVRRHVALRTCVVVQNGIPSPVERSEERFQAATHDLDLQPELAGDSDLERVIQNFFVQPFDLATELPVRMLLITHGDAVQQILLTFHHMAADQQSVVVLLEEFSQIYTAEISPSAAIESLPLPPVVAERPDEANIATFWRDYLSGTSPFVRLPIEGRSRTGSLKGDVVEFELSVTLSQSLLTLAANNDVSLNVLMLSAFGILLHRYSGEDDLVIGMPTSGRAGLHADRAVGCFIQSLPVRSRYESSAPFVSFLQQMQDSVSQILGHAGCPLDGIVRDNNPERLQANPLFQYLLVTQRALPELSIDKDTLLHPRVRHIETSKLDLTMFVTEHPGQLSCCIEFNTDIFSKTVIGQFRDHWISLLCSIVDQSGATLGKLNLLTQNEQQRFQAELAPISLPDLSPPTIHGLFEKCAAQSPRQTAIRFGDQSLTYQQLNEQAHILANVLHTAGVGCGDRVVLHLDRSTNVIVAILGVLKVGAAYVPVSPAEAPDRLRRIISDADPVVILTDRDDLHLPVPLDGCTINVQNPEAFPKNGTPGNGPFREATADHIAYVIYTSGSTGHPKGVEISHRSLILSTLARSDYYSERPERFLLLSPCWFDSSVAGIFWTLTTGGTLVIPPHEREYDVTALGRLISRERITQSLCLPSLYNLLLDHAAPKLLESLRTMIVAGESCSGSVVRKHFQHLPDCELHNEYGPTESTVWATAQKLERQSASEVVAIGKPIGHTRVVLMDQNLQPVPVGLPGEICIVGPTLADGYRNRPELTAEKFLPSPFTTDSSARLYRTGDLGRQLSDGNLLFLGRVDNQLKVNGHRVEAEEVEAAIRTHPDVQDIVVGHPTLCGTDVTEKAESLIGALAVLPENLTEQLLTEAESLSATDEANSLPEISVFRHSDQGVAVQIELPGADSVPTPRPAQRKWLLDQALREATADIQHLQKIAPGLVSGSEDAHKPTDISSARLSDQEIMEDWQTPIMQAMADYATESHGNILEIGFGRGVSATMIQRHGVSSHTIIEANPNSISDYFVPWKESWPDRDIRMIEGRWQDCLGQLATYDAVFFHAFPLNEAEFIEYIADSATFAEHFFPYASSLLRPGGVFTYLTTEIDSLSRQHQRSLFQHFEEVRMRIQSIQVPEDTRDAWWANSMVVLQARKSGAAI